MKYNIDFSNYDKKPIYFRDLRAGDLFIPVDDPETFIIDENTIIYMKTGFAIAAQFNCVSANGTSCFVCNDTPVYKYIGTLNFLCDHFVSEE